MTSAEETDLPWIVLFDTAGADLTGAGPGGTEPQDDQMIGGWPIRPDGSALPFVPNPGYRPVSADSPTDPVDAATRMVVDGAGDGEAVLLALRDSTLWLAVDEEGVPVLDESPDGVSCVLIASSGVHRDRVDGPLWREVTGPELAGLLPAETDLLINYGGPAAMRLIGGVVREAMTN
jgi:hypothetical protein